jgi:hypothetical protein
MLLPPVFFVHLIKPLLFIFQGSTNKPLFFQKGKFATAIILIFAGCGQRSGRDLFLFGGTPAPKRKHNYNRHCLS